MVEAITTDMSAAASASAQDDNLLGGGAAAELKVPAALDGHDDSYEETHMNMNGFFCDNND